MSAKKPLTQLRHQAKFDGISAILNGYDVREFALHIKEGNVITLLTWYDEDGDVMTDEIKSALTADIGDLYRQFHRINVESELFDTMFLNYRLRIVTTQVEKPIDEQGVLVEKD